MPDRPPTDDADFAEPALEALERATGIRYRILGEEPALEPEHPADVVVELQADDAPHRFVVENKANLDRRALLAQVKIQLAPLGDQGLVVTPYLTPTMAERCRALDLQFLDTAGNAYIKRPGLYVFIKGQDRAQADAALMATAAGPNGYRALTPNTLKITFALLCVPDLLNAPYRELAQAADVALGAIGPAYQGLIQRGFVATREGDGGRVLRDRRAMIDDWVATYPVKLRRKLHPRRFRARDPEWWKTAKLPPNAAWGGEVAADRLTNYLKPAKQTLYVRGDAEGDPLKRLVAENRLRHDPLGPIEILHAFWRFAPLKGAHDVVPPLLVYADLLATLQPRCIEVGEMIRKEFLVVDGD